MARRKILSEIDDIPVKVNIQPVVKVEEKQKKALVVVGTRRLNLRSDPSKKMENILTTIPFGTKLNLVSMDGDWAFVEVINSPDEKGYVLREFTKES